MMITLPYLFTEEFGRAELDQLARAFSVAPASRVERRA
jgi:hypothetical protein